MPIVHNFRLIISILATIITIIGFIPYFRDILSRKTKPHLYTWLIWAITQGTATLALWYGGGAYAVLSLAVGTILVVVITLLCLKYGSKDITLSDTICLIISLLAIVTWWQLKNPLISVIMISLIDGIGYIPTYRKSLKEPWSETLSYWAIMALATLMTIIASPEYNFLTLTYLTVMLFSNITVLLICYFGRKIIPRVI